MKSLALKWRLAIPVALATALGMALVCDLAYDTFRDLVLTQADRSLLSVGEAIRTIMDEPTLAEDRARQINTVFTAMEARGEEKKQPHLIAQVWKDQDGGDAVAFGSDVGLQALRARIRQLQAPAEGQRAWFDLRSPQRRYRAVWLRVVLKEGPSNIVVAQTTSRLYGELHELLTKLVLTTLGVVVAVIVMSGALIMLGLRPIRLTAHKLAGITAGNIAQWDLPSRSVPAELEPFVHTVTQMLDRLNAALRQQKAFIADAAHELRTPIAVAKSTLQVALAADRSAQEYGQALQDATEDLRRLEHLVDELLVLAHLDEIDGLPQAAELDLARLLADLVESFRSQVARADGSLVCDVAAVRVRGDAQQLRRLFSNLLDNAVRHGPPGGEIRLVAHDEGPAVTVLVQDQGGRIPARDLPHLFDRFYRSDSSRSQSTGGAGLGLAIAKAIVNRHGGSIGIDSNPARGTCIRVSLPGLPASPEPSTPNPNPNPRVSRGGSNLLRQGTKNCIASFPRHETRELKKFAAPWFRADMRNWAELCGLCGIQSSSILIG